MPPPAGRYLAVSSSTVAGWAYVSTAGVASDMAIVVTCGDGRESLDGGGSRLLLWDEDLSRDTGMEGWSLTSF